MRLVIFSLNSDPLGAYGDEFTGGQAKYVRDVSAYLIGRGWTVDIVTLSQSAKFEIETPTKSCRVIRVPLIGGNRLTYDDGADVIGPILTHIFEALGDLAAIDLLLSCYWLSAIPALALQASHRIPHVFSMCSSGIIKQRITNTVFTDRVVTERKAVATATATIAATPSEIETLRSLYSADPKRLVLIGRGIDLEKFQRRPRILYVGCSTWSKGLDLLLAAVQSIQEFTWHLVLIGPTEADLARCGYTQDSFAGRVSVLWRQPNEHVATELGMCDLLVVPSRYETFGNVALEAMAASVAVIAARVGGLQDLVEHGVSGLLFEPENVDDLASKIRLAISNRPRLVAMGEHGRNRALSFGWAAVGAQTAGFFRTGRNEGT